MEIGPESKPIDQVAETISGQEVIFQDDHVRVCHPLPSAIPQTEGIHLAVDSGRDLDRENPSDTPDLLRSAYYALAVAKIEAEGKYTEDFWANIQMNARPGFDRSINIYGRNPQSTEGWAKPVNIRDASSQAEIRQPLAENQKKQLTRTAELYLPKWEQLAQNITVFASGVNETLPDDPAFQQEKEKWSDRPDPWQEQLIWMNEKFSLVIVKNPHLNGLHLVCHARQDYWQNQAQQAVVKAWETPKPGEAPTFIQGFIESNAILLGVQNLIKNKFFNPEIHYSGNWGFKPLDPVSDSVGGRTVQNEYLADNDLPHARKKEKIASEQRWQGGEPDWHAHGHLYATRSPDQYVALPSRSMREVPQEWEGINALSPEEEADITSLIQTELTSWLENNAQGVKIG